jgi:phosphopantetheinyl transferase
MLSTKRTIITIFNPQDPNDILKTDLHAILTHEENLEYQKMDPIPKKDFVAGRIALREALACFAKMKSKSFSLQVKISYRKSGKPFLVGAKNPEISISHSNGYGAALVSESKYIAIDIEKIKARNINTIEYILSKEEQGLIKTKITDEILTVFWTMKEAIMKAVGIGLVSPHLIVLESFLLYDDTYIANFMYQSSHAAEIEFWTTRTILVDRYAISVAYSRKLHESIIFDWTFKTGLQTPEHLSIS